MKLLQQALKTLKDTISSIWGSAEFPTQVLPPSPESGTLMSLPSNGYTRKEFDYCYPVLIQLWRSRDAAECVRLKTKLAQRRMWYAEALI
jgi:hypothetical protein